eukprot:403372823
MWAGKIHYLQDLKTKKQSVLNQIQNETLALYQHQNSEKDPNDLKSKFILIQSSSDSQDKIKSLTSIDDTNELILSMFQVLAYLEVQAQAYLESDIHLIKQYFDSAYSTNQRDRLLTYLQLSSYIKKRSSQQQSNLGASQQNFNISQSVVNQSLDTSYSSQATRLGTASGRQQQNQVQQLQCTHKPVDLQKLQASYKNEGITSLRTLKNQLLTEEAINYIINQVQELKLNYDQQIEQLEKDLTTQDQQFKSLNKEYEKAKSQVVPLLEDKEKLMNENMSQKLDYEKLRLSYQKQIDELQNLIINQKPNTTIDNTQQDKFKELEDQIELLQNDNINLRENELNLENEIRFLLEQVKKFEQLDNDYKTLQSSTDLMMSEHQKEVEKMQLDNQKELDKVQEILKSEMSNPNELIEKEYKDKLQLQLSEISKLKHELSLAKDQQDLIETLKEQIAQLKLLLNSKLDFINELQDSHVSQERTIKERQNEIQNQKDQIALLSKSLKDFLNNQSTQSMSDDYESVLREEFELMRKQFEIKVQSLKEEIETQQRSHSKINHQSIKEIEDLKIQRDTLTNRLVKLRLDNK